MAAIVRCDRCGKVVEQRAACKLVVKTPGQYYLHKEIVNGYTHDMCAECNLELVSYLRSFFSENDGEIE